MARLRGHRTLDVEQPLYVRRAVLTLNGKTLTVGDVLPWRALKLTARKLLQLWQGRRIGHEKADERNGAENPVELVKPIDTSPAPTALPAVSVQPGAPFVDHSTTGQKRTFVVDGKPMEFTSGPTVHVETPEQQRSKHRPKR